MRQIELFAGIGGFGLAGEWAGIETVCQVEIDPFCQQVLQKNFPHAQRHDDIFTFDSRPYAGTVDIISGGFPCQPFSLAGKRKGTADDRHLWPEMLRVIREVRPAWVVGENVAGLVSMDGGRVFESILSDLESIGYTVEAFVIPACALGAPHRRDRVWIVANGNSPRLQRANRVFDPTLPSKKNKLIEDANRFRRGGVIPEECPDSGEQRQLGPGNVIRLPWQQPWIEVAPRLCGVDDGVSRRVDKHRAERLKALGNAVVPHVAYQIFQVIQFLEQCTSR